MVSESPCLVLLRSSPSCEPYDNGENEHSLGQYNKEGVVVHILYECICVWPMWGRGITQVVGAWSCVQSWKLVGKFVSPSVCFVFQIAVTG